MVASSMCLSPAGIKAAVCRALDDPKNLNIHFVLSTVEVSGTALHEVAQAIRDDRIGVEVDPYIGDGDGLYSQTEDKFFFRSESVIKQILSGDAFARALVVHEGVHALCDMLMKKKEVWRPNAEAAGYLAQAWSFREHGYPRTESALQGATGVFYDSRLLNQFINTMQLLMWRALVIVDKWKDGTYDPMKDVTLQPGGLDDFRNLKFELVKIKMYKDIEAECTRYNGLAKPPPKPPAKPAVKPKKVAMSWR